MDFQEYLREGLGDYLGATLAPTKPSTAPLPLRQSSTTFVKTQTRANPKTVSTTGGGTPTASAAPTQRRLTTAPRSTSSSASKTPSGSGSPGPSFPEAEPTSDAPSPFIPTAEPSSNLPSVPDNRFVPSREGGGRRRRFPWWLVLVAIGTAYVMTEDRT